MSLSKRSSQTEHIHNNILLLFLRLLFILFISLEQQTKKMDTHTCFRFV